MRIRNYIPAFQVVNNTIKDNNIEYYETHGCEFLRKDENCTFITHLINATPDLISFYLLDSYSQSFGENIDTICKTENKSNLIFLPIDI